MYKQYKKLFKPLSWWEKLFKTRLDKNIYGGDYKYKKYYIPAGYNIISLLEIYYFPIGYKDIFAKIFEYYVNNIKLDLEYAILIKKISIEEIYNLFISSKSVQKEILALIEFRKNKAELPIQKYKENLGIRV